MAIVPTWYFNKATPVDNDSLWGYDSEAVENKNFLFSAIQTYVLNWLTTTDVSEWTNLYYTDARVDANSTVTWKADKTNVIEKDSTTAYTPTLWTHPANKDYVDNAGTNINWLTEEAWVANWDEFIYYNGSENVKVDFEDLITAIKSEISWVEVMYTSLEQTSVSNNQLFTFTHNLWLTQSDIEANRYEVFLCSRVSGATELLWKQAGSSSWLWGWNGWRAVVDHIWTATAPAIWEIRQVNHQANSLQIRTGSDWVDIDSFRLVIHKLY